MQTGGQLLVQALEAHGVKVVFGIPGSHTVPIYTALMDSSIAHVLVRHEQGASFAADGYARVTGQPGVCITITGPGLTNALTGIAQAYSDSSPMLVVSAQLPTTVLDSGWRGQLHELKDQERMMDAVCAYSRRITRAEEIPEAVDEAYHHFATARPRPVHLSIPLDILGAGAADKGDSPTSQPCSTASGAVPSTLASTCTGSGLDQEQALAVLRLLHGAHNPLLICGGGATKAAPAIRRLVDLLALPVLCTVNGKGIVPDDHPLTLPSTNRWMAEMQEIFRDRDVVLCVGTELTAADVGPHPFAPTCQVIQIDIDPQQIGCNVPVTMGLVADIQAAVTSLLETLPASRGTVAEEFALPDGQATTRRSRVDRVADQWQRLRDVAATRPHAQIYQRAAAAVRTVLGRDGILVNDTTEFSHQASYAYPVYDTGTWLYPRDFGTLGFSVAAAIGAKLGRPNCRVISVSGDGGFQFTMAELGTAVQHDLPVLFLVFNNGGHGTVRRFQEADSGGRTLGCDLVNPDFVALAKAYGLPAFRVTDAGNELLTCLKACAEGGRAALIEIEVPQ